MWPANLIFGGYSTSRHFFRRIFGRTLFIGFSAVNEKNHSLAIGYMHRQTHSSADQDRRNLIMPLSWLNNSNAIKPWVKPGTARSSKTRPGGEPARPYGYYCFCISSGTIESFHYVFEATYIMSVAATLAIAAARACGRSWSPCRAGYYPFQPQRLSSLITSPRQDE